MSAPEISDAELAAIALRLVRTLGAVPPERQGDMPRLVRDLAAAREEISALRALVDAREEAEEAEASVVEAYATGAAAMALRLAAWEAERSPMRGVPGAVNTATAWSRWLCARADALDTEEYGPEAGPRG